MTTKYKILFTVELLNNYYSDLKCNDFQIVPSANTASLLKNYQMVVKEVGNKLIVLVKVHAEGPEADTPFIDIDPQTKWVFYMALQNTLFNTVTNLDADKLTARQRFYFSNVHQNKAGTVLNLTKKIDSFPNLQPYQPGDLVDNGTGLIFECIQSTGAANNTSNANFWFERGNTQLVSSQDMIQVVSRVARYKTDVLAHQFAIAVFELNTASGLFDKEVKIKNNLITTHPTAVDEVQLDLSELKPGRYKVRINAKEYLVWIDDEMIHHSFFGVIEIFSHLPASSDFSFFDAQGRVKDKKVGMTNEWLKYTILYANRLAYWKYIVTNKGVASIDGSSGFSFHPTPAVGNPKDYFTSNKPVPLQQTPWEFKVHLSSPISNEPPLLPNPNPVNSGMFGRSEPEKDYYCTIYLNY